MKNNMKTIPNDVCGNVFFSGPEKCPAKVFQFMNFGAKNWTGAVVERAGAVIIAFFMAISAHAANWYLDKDATGARTGVSWANAWTSPPQIVWGSAGVKGGDTLYISGGSVSKTYTEYWTVGASGSSGNPITIRPGQESGHNGVVIFDYSAGGTANGAQAAVTQSGRSYLTWDGEYNGQSHFRFQHLRNVMGRYLCRTFYNNGGDQHVYRYITITNCNNGMWEGVRLVEQCRFEKMVGDYAINATHNTVEAFDQVIIRSNFIESAWNNAVAPGGSGNWTGPDGVWADHGVTLLHNVFLCTRVSYYTSDQHTDFVQATGNYIKCYANEFINIGDSAFDYGVYVRANPHDVWVYNNLFRITTALDPYPEFFRFYGYGINVGSISNFKILNNTFVDHSGYIMLRFDTFNGNPTASGNEIKNNIFCNIGSTIISIDASTGFNSGSFELANNVYCVSSGGISYRGSSYNVSNWVRSVDTTSKTNLPLFASYTPLGVNNNLHLQPADTVAKDSGVDLSSSFTKDKDGKTRSAPWDIGAYEYGSGGVSTNLPPTVSSITNNATDINSVTPGLQVFTGALVQNSGSASDPNGDPIAWQWIYTVNSGAEVILQSGTGAVTTATYTYPSNSAGSNYVWKLRANDGLAASESQLSIGVESPPAVVDGLVFQAESGVVTSPFVVTAGYISQPSQTSVTTGGRAAYTFTITNAGNYVIQALVNAPGDAANSFYVNMDAEPQDPAMVWQIPVTAGFENRIVNWQGSGTYDNPQYVPKVFALTLGSHQLIIRGREAGAQLDRISILMLPTPPLDFRILP